MDRDENQEQGVYESEARPKVGIVSWLGPTADSQSVFPIPKLLGTTQLRLYAINNRFSCRRPSIFEDKIRMAQEMAVKLFTFS